MGLHHRPISRAAAIAGAAALLLASACAEKALADPAAPIWSGAYGGVHLGADWAEAEAAGLDSPHATAFAWGLHAGYNLELSGFVIGVEGDANFADANYDYSTGAGATATLETDWSGSLRARLGMPIGPALVYGTLGYAWSSTNLTEIAASGDRSSSDHTFGGIVYGIGAESFVMPNISLRLEALHYDFSADALSLGGATAGLTEVDPSETVFRAGVTFHLD